MTCPNPFVGDNVIFCPASNWVTPPFKAYDDVVELFDQDAVPNNEPVKLPVKEPVIPLVTIKDPVITELFCAMSPLRALNSFAMFLSFLYPTKVLL